MQETQDQMFRPAGKGSLHQMPEEWNTMRAPQLDAEVY